MNAEFVLLQRYLSFFVLSKDPGKRVYKSAVTLVGERISKSRSEILDLQNYK
jgi:hypothetical protein